MKQEPLTMHQTQSPHPTARLIEISEATRRVLADTVVKMTPALWRAIAGSDSVDQGDERLGDLGFYTLFALAKLTAAQVGAQEDSRGLLVPVAFDTGNFNMRIEAHRDEHEKIVLRLSLADEPPFKEA